MWVYRGFSFDLFRTFWIIFDEFFCIDVFHIITTLIALITQLTNYDTSILFIRPFIWVIHQKYLRNTLSTLYIFVSLDGFVLSHCVGCSLYGNWGPEIVLLVGSTKPVNNGGPTCGRAAAVAASMVVFGLRILLRKRIRKERIWWIQQLRFNLFFRTYLFSP